MTKPRFQLLHNILIIWSHKYRIYCNPEGWDGEGGGRGDRDGEHM